jgi:hypothetical protein
MRRGQLATPFSRNNGAVILDCYGTYVDTLQYDEVVLVLTDVMYAPWHNSDGRNYSPMYHAVLTRGAVYWVFVGQMTEAT